MASMLMKVVGKRIFKETSQNHFGQEDPYFEEVPAERLGGRRFLKKTKKRRKALPPGISENDAHVLTKVKRRAYRLDLSLFNCCGIRFGWSSVIGIIPFAGDAFDLMMAYMVLRTCQGIDGGLPTTIKSQMQFNIVIDFVIGLIPFLGDVADALYKCNTRNAVLLEKHLRKQGSKNLERAGKPVPTFDPSMADEFDRSEADLTERHGGPPPQYDDDTTRGHSRRDQGPAAAPPAQTRSGGGYFGGRGGRNADSAMEEGRAPAQPPRR